MTEQEVDSFLAEVREVSAALRRGEMKHADDLLRACRLMERLPEIPPGPLTERARVIVDEALQLALEMQAVRQTALTQGGASRRAIGAYARRR